VRRALLVILPLILATPAEAATRWVVSGGGFGHGIGMSQYGAYGFAQHGRGYRQILSHYYTGTRIGSAAGRRVRVLLQASDPYVRFRGATRAGGEQLNPTSLYRVDPSRSGLTLRKGRKVVARFTAPFKVHRPQEPIRLMGPAINGVNDGLYRGTMELRAGADGGVTAINVIKVDPYIQGVVPGEMPANWHMEALKAQAVAARTYALATSLDGGVFDLYPDTRSQVYRGVSAETSRTNAAVAATDNEVVDYDGGIVTTYYFSTSGGHTENIENSFIGADPQPWLKGVEDPYDDISPRHRWRLRFTPDRLDSALGAPGRLRKVRVIKRGVSPRIVRARVYGTRGTRTLSGPTIRSRLGLYDTWAYFTKVSSSSAATPSVARTFGIARLQRYLLTGVFQPAPRGRRLAVERRSGRRWEPVAVARTTRSGQYRVRLARAGVYRVRRDAIVGPRVRVR
jgi:stage II sporulation protein D